MNAQTWTTADFDAMSWHDVRVYGFRLVDEHPEQGSADLIFDIDYILEWTGAGPGLPFTFTIAQANLRFHDVYGLSVALDYKTPGAGMSPFSLAEVRRRKLDGRDDYVWELKVNWPSGKIEFEASGFTQVLTGPPVTQSQQRLGAKDRN